VDRFRLVPGTSYLSRAGEMHYFVNDSDDLFRAFFVKAPFDPADTNPLPWAPGSPVPRRVDGTGRRHGGGHEAAHLRPQPPCQGRQ
jgi:hypothetical protein